MVQSDWPKLENSFKIPSIENKGQAPKLRKKSEVKKFLRREGNAKEKYKKNPLLLNHE